MKTVLFIALGVLISCALGAGAGFATRTKKPPLDLTPTTIVIGAQDTEADAPLTADRTRELTVAAAYVTESMIRPADLAKVAGRKLTFPLNEADVLTWQHFARLDRQRALEKCVLSFHAGTEAAAEERVTSELASMVVPELAVTPPPPLPPGDTVRIVAAALDLKEGTALSTASLQIIEVPVSIFTDSLILEADQGLIINAKVVSEVLAGDMLNWPLLRREGVVGVNTCVAQLDAAAHTARDEFAKKSASTFDPGTTP